MEINQKMYTLKELFVKRPTMFLKVAHVLLVEVLCSNMAVLLISSPTFSLSGEKQRERLENICMFYKCMLDL